MKTIYTLTLLALCTQFALAVNEVPNPGLENWSGGNPSTWFSNNQNGVATPITMSSTSHSGNYAAKLQPVISSLNGDTVAPLMASNTPGQAFPITANYSMLEFYYMSGFSGGDQAEVTVAIIDSGSNIVGNGLITITASEGSWVHASVPITYSGSTSAVKAFITISIGTGTSFYPQLTSYLIVDDFSLMEVTGVNEVSGDDKLQVYPVPAHDVLTVKTTTLVNYTTSLILTDALGRIVMQRDFITDFSQHDLNLQGIIPGAYSVMLVSKEKSLVRRIIIQ